MHHTFKRKMRHWHCQREKLSRDTESLGKLAKVARRGVNVLSALVRISDFKLELPCIVMGGMGGALLHGPNGGKVPVSPEANGHCFGQTSKSGSGVPIKYQIRLNAAQHMAALSICLDFFCFSPKQ